MRKILLQLLIGATTLSAAATAWAQPEDERQVRVSVRARASDLAQYEPEQWAAVRVEGVNPRDEDVQSQIAVHFAYRNPERTRGLILIDPVFQSALGARQRRLRRYRWLAQGAVAVIRGLNALGLHRRRVQDRDLRELDEETRQAIRGDESFEAIARRYGALGPILKHMPTANYLRQALATVSPLPPLSDIWVPVLGLLSGGTTLADVERTRAELARFPNCEIVTLAANHWPLTETPEAVREAIDEWVCRRFG